MEQSGFGLVEESEANQAFEFLQNFLRTAANDAPSVQNQNNPTRTTGIKAKAQWS